MTKRFFKSSIALVLALSITLMPNTFANAQMNTNDNTYQTTIGEATLTSTPAVTNYDEAKAIAKKKAAFLTSIYGSTSIQYALIDDGTIVLSGQSGVYSKDTKTTPTADNMYGIGSISKMFTTAAVMKLVDEGKVNLDTPVVTYIPDFTMADPRYKAITVRMLLNHSSGLMGSTFHNSILFNDNDTYSHDNFLNTLKTARLKADPGAFSVYCNDGFTLAELLVEKVSGVSFTNYIENNISTPLRLTNTKTPMDTFDRNNLSKTYLPGSKQTLPVESLNSIGAGGMYSSAENLCQFAKIFMKTSTTKVLSEDSVTAMENPEYLKGLWPKNTDALLSYGLGWDSVNTYPFTDYGIKAVVKGGDTTLYHGSLIILPDENIAMAVLSSSGSSAYDQIMAQEVILSVLKSKGKIPEIKPKKTFTAPVKAAMPSTYKKYEGFYGNFGNILKAEISDDGELSLSSALVPEGGSQKFVYTGDGKFYYSDGSTYLSFVEESNGKTYLYSSAYSNLTGIGQIFNAGYQGQKLDSNAISDQVKATWAKRINKKYFIVNEKYSSVLYILENLIFSTSTPKDLEGYFAYAAITDENNTLSTLQIPAVYGRDLTDFQFYTAGNIEYLKMRDYIAIPEDAIKPLSAKSSFTCNINNDGFAHWYKINKSTGKKKIKVSLPKNAAFTVYDVNGHCVNNSYLSNITTVKLPSKGYIVFTGDANAKFTVKYVK